MCSPLPPWGKPALCRCAAVLVKQLWRGAPQSRPVHPAAIRTPSGLHPAPHLVNTQNPPPLPDTIPTPIPVPDTSLRSFIKGTSTGGASASRTGTRGQISPRPTSCCWIPPATARQGLTACAVIHHALGPCSLLLWELTSSPACPRQCQGTARAGDSGTATPSRYHHGRHRRWAAGTARSLPPLRVCGLRGHPRTHRGSDPRAEPVGTGGSWSGRRQQDGQQSNRGGFPCTQQSPGH